MENFGYAGQILRIDLTTSKIEKEPLDMGMAKQFIGGLGISAKLLYDAVKPNTDALSPGNALVITAGVFSGTALPGAPKTDWSSKSPLTGLIQTAACSGLGAHLKWAGYDSVVITGKADRPVYITIFDNEVKINDASDLWGKDIYEATDELWDRYDNTCTIACIGPAAEKLARISMAYVNKMSTTGREGSGAVFGSKNLKGIVVRGSKGLKVANTNALLEKADELHQRFLQDPLLEDWMALGTTIALENYGKIGNVVWKNWREAYPLEKHIPRFGVESFLKVREISIPCTGCSLGCKLLYHVREGEFAGLESLQACNVGAVISWGPHFDLEGYDQVVKCHDTANRYGIDSIEAACTLDFVMDLQEQGIISKEVTDGLELKRDLNTALVWLEKIAKREGFGDVLADGYPGLFKALGPGVEKYAIHRGGSTPDFDARGVFGAEAFGGAISIKGPHCQLALGLTVLPGRNIEGMKKYAHTIGVPEEAMSRIFTGGAAGFNPATFTRYCEAWNTACGLMGICNRPPLIRLYSLSSIAEIYHLTTGIKVEPSELLTAADRYVTLAKAFNIRQGATRKDDSLPERYFTEPLLMAGEKESWLSDYYETKKIAKEDFDSLVNDYYEERGWDIDTGVPTKQTLSALGLEDVAADLADVKQNK